MSSVADAARASRAARALCIAAAALVAPMTLSGQSPMKRGMGATTTSLIIDGISVGATSVTGGTASAHVVSNNTGPDGTTKKHVANVRWTDIVAEAPLGSKPLIDWIRTTLEGKIVTKNGSIVSGAGAERLFLDGMITEIIFPALDATSRDIGSITVKITPQAVRYQQGSGAAQKAGPLAKEQRWTTNAFRFEMDGVDASKVTRVEEIRFRRIVPESQGGIFREPKNVPGTTDLSNIRVTMPDAAAQTWADWLRRFLIEGNHQESDEKNGAIVLLSNDMKSEVARIPLSNCGIVGLDAAEGGNQAMPRMTAELYCERIGFQASGGQ